MSMNSHSIHEPDEELLSAEEAIQDAELLLQRYQERRRTEEPVALQVPLHVLLEAIDHLEPSALRKIIRRAEERLANAPEEA